MTSDSFSYVHGVSPKPLLGETVGRNFDRMAKHHAEREALIVPHQEVCWTYDELKRRVDRLAGGLLSLGLGPGERVGIWSPNNWQWVVTQFATAKSGLILVNINPAYRLGELDYALKKVGCSALITAPAFKSSNYIEMLAQPRFRQRSDRRSHLRAGGHNVPGCDAGMRGAYLSVPNPDMGRQASYMHVNTKTIRNHTG